MLFRKLIQFFYKMSVDKNEILMPPKAVKNMTKWQPDLFKKTVSLPHVELPAKNLSKSKAGKILPKCRIPNFPSIREATEGSDKKIVILDPTAEIGAELKNKVESVFGGKFGEAQYDLNVSNYNGITAIKSVLPDNLSLSSCQYVGHIIYVNLRDELQPYKEIIGQLLLHSTADRIKLVVTKTNTIDNKFRNLNLEILAGDPEAGFEVEVKENGCRFMLDFSKVYWNPRLVTEHQRIVDLVQKGDFVFDVFAGVGPFAIPIGRKKGITIFANDLNPSSYEYLKQNSILNKLDLTHFHTFNLDGGEFIRTVFKEKIHQFLCQDQSQSAGNAHVLMNLPALAMTFVHNFKDILDENEADKLHQRNIYVHVYSFSNEGEADLIKQCCEQMSVEDIPGIQINYVRDVAPNKEMFRVTFPLTIELMTKSKEPLAKKAKIDE